jgi:hypothetical protein
MVFDWPSRHAVHVAVPAMMMVSVLLHGAGLFVFQLKPPSEPASTRRTASVFFLSPTSPDHGKFLPVIASADPSLFSATLSEDPDIWRLPASDYSPSFDEARPEFYPPPAETQPVPARLLSFDSVKARSPQSKKRPAAPAALPTRIVLEGGHSGMEFERAPGISFAAPVRKNLAPMEFLMASGPDGRILHAFPLTSSGDEQIDRSALRALIGGHVRGPNASSKEVIWGQATFLWGSDVQRIPTP